MVVLNEMAWAANLRSGAPETNIVLRLILVYARVEEGGLSIPTRLFAVSHWTYEGRHPKMAR